jgi:hypothetical protein
MNAHQEHIKGEIMLRMKYLVISIVVMLFSITAVSAQSSKLTIKPYGFIKLDMSHDSARTNNGNFAMWVNDAAKSDNEFNMTARQTRIGVNFDYAEMNGKKVTGKFEFDLYNASPENKNAPMVRHAYMKVDYGKFYILAGQTSDIFSPLVPNTVNYTVLWNAGNIGYRRPQLQFVTKCKHGVEYAVALARNVAGDTDGIDGPDGDDSGLPMVQGRIQYGNSKWNAGISGHYGTMEFRNVAGDDDDYTTHSINLHGSYAITDAISVKGEAFSGKTLDQFFGGAGQGFIYDSEEEFESSGGWINAVYAASTNTTFNLGASADQPKQIEKSLTTPLRDSNSCVYANVFTKIAANTTFGFEVSNWTTNYYDTAGYENDNTNLRIQTSFIMNF